MKIYSGEDLNNSDQNIFSEKVPSSLYLLRKTLSYKKQCLRKYVVCIICHSRYYYENCIESFAGQQFSQNCRFVRFPNHTSKHLRKECGQVLLKDFKSISGKQLFVPFKTYCYRSVKESIQTLLACSGWEQDCEKWRDRNTGVGLLTDVYDGKICKTFRYHHDSLNFSEKRNYGVMLNVHWFQPFNHLSNFSIGRICLIPLNLPRHLKFLTENVVLVGIIKDMSKEPPTNMFWNFL